MNCAKERELEKQRYGRNKSTAINHAYINSGEYRNKFNNLSDNEELNRIVYKIAKKMLNHRSGTLLEDMYWIDIDTGEIIASETNIFEFFYKGTVAKYENLGYDEYEAQIMALSEYEAKENISFKEV